MSADWQLDNILTTLPVQTGLLKPAPAWSKLILGPDPGSAPVVSGQVHFDDATKDKLNNSRKGGKCQWAWSRLGSRVRRRRVHEVRASRGLTWSPAHAGPQLDDVGSCYVIQLENQSPSLVLDRRSMQCKLARTTLPDSDSVDSQCCVTARSPSVNALKLQKWFQFSST